MTDQYRVVLEAEDGCYTLAGPMSEQQAVAWIKHNESRYGEGQSLCIEYVGGVE